jgi:hypothetical protein
MFPAELIAQSLQNLFKGAGSGNAKPEPRQEEADTQAPPTKQSRTNLLTKLFDL